MPPKYSQIDATLRRVAPLLQGHRSPLQCGSVHADGVGAHQVHPQRNLRERQSIRQDYCPVFAYRRGSRPVQDATGHVRREPGVPADRGRVLF